MHVVRLEDWVVILSVMGSVIALYLSATFILIRPFVVPASIRPRLGVVGALVLVCTALSACCFIYAMFIEPYQLEVTHVKLKLDSIPAATKPITIVQISDTHCDTNIRLENQVAAEIENIKPSLILFTGDAVNSVDATKNFDAFAERIRKVAPTFAVIGDWDFAFPQAHVLSKLEILNGFKTVELNGVKFCVVGANSGSSLKERLDQAPPGMPTIAMFHNPDADIILKNDTSPVDLYLCGHTHGGQIAMPIYGALITQSIQGKKYESGLHKLGNTWLYTNRGIGMEGHFPRVRFCSRPELTVFELTGSGK